MRRTGRLSARAVAEAMRSTRPGVSEYQLGAVADYFYPRNGARGEGYRPIIAAGANIWHVHYYRCDGALRDGDLVLMDYAPDLCHYTNDIGRMWPVNGMYSPVQRELYGFMVEYHKAVLARIRPGVLPAADLGRGGGGDAAHRRGDGVFQADLRAGGAADTRLQGAPFAPGRHGRP